MTRSILQYLNRYYSNDVSYIALMAGAFFPVIPYYDWDKKKKMDQLVEDLSKLELNNVNS